MSQTDPPQWFHRLAGALPGLRLPVRDVPAALALPVFDSPPRRSAVLILFGSGERGDDVLLTRRSSRLRDHAGQVSFPGGGIEPDDDGPAAAALREAREETGLLTGGVAVHGVGPELFLAVTNFVVVPVLAWWHTPAAVAPVDDDEVEAVVRVPVAELVDPARRFTVRHPSGFVGPGFEAGGLFVWGFTAMVLSGVLSLAGLEQPWDAEAARPVPA